MAFSAALRRSGGAEGDWATLVRTASTCRRSAGEAPGALAAVVIFSAAVIRASVGADGSSTSALNWSITLIDAGRTGGSVFGVFSGGLDGSADDGGGLRAALSDAGVAIALRTACNTSRAILRTSGSLLERSGTSFESALISATRTCPLRNALSRLAAIF